MTHKVPALILVLLWSLMASQLSWGVLGGHVDSVQTDQATLHAQLRAGTSNATYHTTVMQSPSGTTIREYVSANGTVFAIAWQGPSMPNLKQLMGQYFSKFVTAVKQGRHGRNHANFQLQDLVVQANGYLRTFAGRAYVPSLLPTGVSPDEIR